LQPDTAMTVIGGVIVLICSLAVVFTGVLFGWIACLVMFVAVLFLLDEEMSMAAWAFCQAGTSALLRLLGMVQQDEVWQNPDE
jgi:hypothetical protein